MYFWHLSQIFCLRVFSKFLTSPNIVGIAWTNTDVVRTENLPSHSWLESFGVKMLELQSKLDVFSFSMPVLRCDYENIKLSRNWRSLGQAAEGEGWGLKFSVDLSFESKCQELANVAYVAQPYFWWRSIDIGTLPICIFFLHIFLRSKSAISFRQQSLLLIPFICLK